MFYSHLSTGRQRDMELYFCDRDKDLPPGITFGPVIRDAYIVDCCMDGFGGVNINGREFPVKKGDCYILFPGDIIIHSADTKNPRSGVWCAVDGFMIGEYLKQIGITSEQPFAPPEAFDAVVAQIEEMLSMVDDSDSGAPVRRSGCVNKMFGELLRHSRQSDFRTSYLDGALRFIEARYDTQITVEDIADSVGLDRSYFSSLFKENTGMSPYQYLRQVRIKKACALITNGKYKINAAAEAVGISPESFARTFRQETGMTPGEYIKKSEQNGFKQNDPTSNGTKYV